MQTPNGDGSSTDTTVKFSANGDVQSTITTVGEPDGTFSTALSELLDNNAANAPAGITVGQNQFYVDAGHDNWTEISQVTGVSVDDLLVANPGGTIVEQLSAGTLINLPPVDNSHSPTITVNPNPQTQTQVANENQLSQNAANGYVSKSLTSSVSFSGNTLNATDFASAQMGSLASGGVRPGEVQLDPNARPNSYLAQFHVDPSSTTDANSTELNAATLNGLAAMTTVNTYVDPILLDLTGNGVHMTPVSNGVLFDTDNSGTEKRTGWADTSTGMLVVDNGSGQITNMSQMFSQYYGGQAGTNGGPGQAPFKNGFAALASVDGNHDGVIDASDPIWSQLRVWVDANHDGQVEAGELKTLDELGITQINVSATAAATGEMRDGNAVLAHGTFIINGKEQEALAADFVGSAVSNTFTTQGDGTRVTSNANGTTSTAYTSTSTANETLDAGQLGVNNVYAGSGNDTLIAAPGGSWLVGGGGSNTYVGGAGNDVFVISAKDNPANIHGNGGVDTAIIVGGEGVTLDMASAGLTIAEGGSGDDVIESGGRQGVFIKGGSGDDTLIGGAGNDVIVGGSGHNLIIGGTGQAEIYAGPNGDTVYGAQGDSVIYAGGGADHIYGGAGNDVITVGRGNAVIDGGGGTNLVTLHGSYGDYRIVRGTYQGATGYWVADKVPNRDGTVFLTNVQKLNFADLSAVDLSLPNPMPVANTLTTDAAGQAFNHTQPHLIAAAQLLANAQRLSSKGPLHIAAVSDALGGTVALTQSGDVLFTPDASYTGLMSFKFSLADAAGDPSFTVLDTATGQTAAMRAVATLQTPDLPSDPLFAQEWYLNDTDVLPLWQDYTGKGVHIGQFEVGGQYAVGPEIFNYTHPDLAQNVDPAWLAAQQANGTLPTSTSNHATMVAGVMVAARNGIGGVGVAYDASLAGFALSSANMGGLSHMVSYDIANNSWNFSTDFALSNLAQGANSFASAALSNAQYAADNGRAGLGTVIVEAGGNARATGGNAEGSLTNANRFSIEVGAIDAQGDLSTLHNGVAPFSNPGASLLVSAPGSNVQSTSQIVLTDQGSTFGSSYNTMQGTSFATPIVSGIVALMLQANPNLGYRDVQAILALSARKVHDAATQWSDNGADNWNGGGLHVSNDYGFGEVDARAAVRLAETWTTQSTGANERMVQATSGALGESASAGQTLTSTLAMNAGLNVEHVEVDLDANVGRLGDLVVTLVAPDGATSVLLNREGMAPAGSSGASTSDVGSTQSGEFQYTFMSTHDWGEVSTGNWTLQVTDAATGLPVTLNSWALRLYGSATTPDHTYYYTDEYQAAVLANANRAILDPMVDGAGGRDTINAAAVSGDVSINLLTGVASLGGTALTIRNPNAIENLVSGDGNDTLVANNADALLDGGRGQNTLVGGTGKDEFVVHRRDAGTDTIVNFNAAQGETIDLVGFTGKSFADLALTQQGADVKVDLGNGQSIVLTNQTVAALGAAQFVFQDTFAAPAAYFSSVSGTSGTAQPALAGVVSTPVWGAGVAPMAVSVPATSEPDAVTVIGTNQGVSTTTDASGVVTVQSSVDYALSESINQLSLTGAADLVGTANNNGDVLTGNAGNDTLLGGDGNDTLVAGAGNDLMVGGEGANTYIVNAGGGTDTIQASAGQLDTLVVQGVTPGAVRLSAQGDDLLITLNAGQAGASQVVVSNQFNGQGVGEITLGTQSLSAATVAAIVQTGSLTSTEPLATQTVAAGSAWSYALPLTLFNASVSGDTLTYVATLADGSALPSWLTFNAVTQTFGGTPTDANTGPLVLNVTATDLAGLSATASLNVQVDPTYAAPTVTRSLATQTATGGSAFSYTLPADLFNAAIAGDVLTDSATLANGNALPAWLSFNAATGTFSGTPTDLTTGPVALAVTATDLGGMSASTTLNLQVNAGYATPTVAQSLAAQSATAGTAWSYSLPAGLFSEAIAGDTLTYAATLANGNALPAWLKFNPATATFTGTPTDQTTGALALSITATDEGGLSASIELALQVNPLYRAPIVTQSLLSQSTTVGTGFSYTLPTGLFAQGVIGDTLTLQATQANGQALPNWLNFNATTGQFSGVPTSDATGISVAVTATDMGGLTASTSFSVAVASAPPLVRGGNVWVQGLSIAGQILTAGNTLVDPAGMGPVTYQWQSSADGQTWVNIAGATGVTFTSQGAQTGQQVRALASYTDGTGVTEQIASVGRAVLASSSTNVTNAQGQVTEQDFYSGSGTRAGSISYSYNASGQLSCTRGSDALGHTLGYTYYTAGAVSLSLVYEADSTGHMSEMDVFDGTGALTSRVRYSSTGQTLENDSFSAGVLAGRTTFVYDSSGHLLESNSYNASGQLVAQNLNNAAGQNIEYDSYQNGQLSGQTRYVYNASGQIVEDDVYNGSRQLVDVQLFDTAGHRYEVDTYTAGVLTSKNLWACDSQGRVYASDTYSGSGPLTASSLYDGNGTYTFASGDGQAVFIPQEASTAQTDVLNLNGINSNQLWFSQKGNNLEIDVIGTADKMTVANWFSNPLDHIQQIHAADGLTLADTSVSLMIQAMASLTPPPMGQLTYTPAEQSTLQPVLAANWH